MCLFLLKMFLNFCKDSVDRHKLSDNIFWQQQEYIVIQFMILELNISKLYALE